MKAIYLLTNNFKCIIKQFLSIKSTLLVYLHKLKPTERKRKNVPRARNILAKSPMTISFVRDRVFFAYVI